MKPTTQPQDATQTVAIRHHSIGETDTTVIQQVDIICQALEAVADQSPNIAGKTATYLIDFCRYARLALFKPKYKAYVLQNRNLFCIAFLKMPYDTVKATKASSEAVAAIISVCGLLGL
jgi:hypothetical protein